MKKFSTAALSVAALALVLTGCDSGPEPTTSSSAAAGGPTGVTTSGVPQPDSFPAGCEAPGGGKLQIGLVTPNLQALFFNQINTGAQTIADKVGADLQIVSANDDPLQQANAIDNLVAKKVQAIIVAAIDTEGIKPAIQAADKAGVKIVAVDGIVEDPAVSSQVGTSNEESGAQMGEFLAKLANDTGEVGVVSALNSTIQLERQKGFEDAVMTKGMSMGTIVDGKNVQETAQSAAENLLTGNPDLKYVYATGEPALIGLVAGVKNQNAQDKTDVVGWDLSEAAVSGLQDGFVKGVVQQNTFKFGYDAMTAAIDLSCGEVVEKNIPVPTQIVTPDNVADFLYYLEK
ncbi:substrate-binding domain-containing protein [Paeniglutamicibacter sp. MACA_103]|uniref:substrate-binding domain-containing protein n=1 Tax=Paeniglutamicibacter sp. MACA_103 TaxID=3377337 RepID=UPI003892E2A6